MAPKKQEDWKRQRLAMDAPSDDPRAAVKGSVILRAGTRMSKGNQPDLEEHKNRWARMLYLMEKNRRKRLHPGLKGLFGGGE